MDISIAISFIFFFQAEDGIRDRTVTGVQTCALPIYSDAGRAETVMPTHLFAESPGDERRGNDSAVDEEVVNLERIRAPIIAGWIQGAHLAGKVSLKTTN